MLCGPLVQSVALCTCTQGHTPVHQSPPSYICHASLSSHSAPPFLVQLVKLTRHPNIARSPPSHTRFGSAKTSAKTFLCLGSTHAASTHIFFATQQPLSSSDDGPHDGRTKRRPPLAARTGTERGPGGRRMAASGSLPLPLAALDTSLKSRDPDHVGPRCAPSAGNPAPAKKSATAGPVVCRTKPGVQVGHRGVAPRAKSATGPYCGSIAMMLSHLPSWHPPGNTNARSRDKAKRANEPAQPAHDPI